MLNPECKGQYYFFPLNSLLTACALATTSRQAKQFIRRLAAPDFPLMNLSFLQHLSVEAGGRRVSAASMILGMLRM
jgi:hypothetical protein